MRNHWSGSFGFILAAVGSAVGLGNIWKFPYITGMNGGGAFVLVYLVAILLCGMPLLMAEFAIGRHSQKDVVGSFRDLMPKSRGWQIVGWLNLSAAFIILSYYGVIAGWTLFYLFEALTNNFAGQSPEAIDAVFGGLVTSPTTLLLCLTYFTILVVIAVASGIKEGIERWNKVMMPTLFGIVILLGLYSLTTPGAAAGWKFMLYPDFSKLTMGGVLEAIGHSFFTLSIAMGALVTYASYMDKKEKLFPVAIRIAFLDTIVAIGAGLAIFPIVFSFGMEPGAGPGLIFKTLPKAFAQMPFGSVLGTLFFILMAFAALSSAISLLEVLTAFAIDEKKVDRKKATIIMAIAVYIAGIPSALSYSTFSDITIWGGMPILDGLDYMASNYMLPIGGLLIAVYAGFIVDKRIMLAEITEDGANYVKVFKVWYFTIRYVTPVLVFVVFLKSVGLLDMLG